MYLKHIFILLIMSVSVSSISAQPSWIVNTRSYEFNMTITSVISLNDTLVENTKGVIVGAFDINNNCVGKAEALYYNSVKKYRVPLMVFSNQNNVEIHLKGYIPGQTSIFDLSTSIQFESNGGLGNFVTPFELMTESLTTDIFYKDETTESISAFPNPAKELLNIHVQTDNTPYQIFMYSLTGELIKQQNGNLENESINVSQLPPGTYVLQIKSSKGVFTKKIIKK